MKKGKVKFYNATKGYGFIIDRESGSDIFVHATGLSVNHIQKDDEVSFEITDGKKGKSATNVQIIE